MTVFLNDRKLNYDHVKNQLQSLLQKRLIRGPKSVLLTQLRELFLPFSVLHQITLLFAFHQKEAEERKRRIQRKKETRFCVVVIPIGKKRRPFRPSLASARDDPRARPKEWDFRKIPPFLFFLPHPFLLLSQLNISALLPLCFPLRGVNFRLHCGLSVSDHFR